MAKNGKGNHYTLKDVWHAIEYKRNFNYAFWLDILLNIIAENIMHYIGHMFVFAAVCLVAVLGYCGIFIVVPLVSEPWSWQYCMHCGLGAFMIFNIYFNYYFAITTKPGAPSQQA